MSGQVNAGIDLDYLRAHGFDDAADTIERLTSRAEVAEADFATLQNRIETVEIDRAVAEAERDRLREALNRAAEIADDWATDMQRKHGNGGPAAEIREMARAALNGEDAP